MNEAYLQRQLNEARSAFIADLIRSAQDANIEADLQVANLRRAEAKSRRADLKADRRNALIIKVIERDPRQYVLDDENNPTCKYVLQDEWPGWATRPLNPEVLTIHGSHVSQGDR